MPAMVDWVLEPLGDDLNTPLALSRLRDLRTLENVANVGGSAAAVHARTPAPWDPAPGVARASVLAAARVLGLLWHDAIEWRQGLGATFGGYMSAALTGTSTMTAMGTSVVVRTVESIEAAIAARLTARAEKNWAEADRIRAELTAQGIVLEDGAGSTTWRRA